MLPGHLLARHIDDFLTDLANANRPHNTIRAYRGDLTGFASFQPARRVRRKT
jgi:site-specific recombinase XerD